MNTHQKICTFTAPDGFVADIYSRPGVNGGEIFYAKHPKDGTVLFGGQCFPNRDAAARALRQEDQA